MVAEGEPQVNNFPAVYATLVVDTTYHYEKLPEKQREDNKNFSIISSIITMI